MGWADPEYYRFNDGNKPTTYTHPLYEKSRVEHWLCEKKLGRFRKAEFLPRF